MARQRPKASDVSRPALTCLDGGITDTILPLLTRAQASALRRSAAHTHARLVKHLEGIAPDSQRLGISAQDLPQRCELNRRRNS